MDNAKEIPAPTEATSPLKGWLQLLAVLLIWAGTPVLARYLGDWFNPIEQSCYRYTFSTLFLWTALALFFRRPLREYTPDWYRLLAACVCILVYQIAWVTAVYFISATLTHLLLKLNVLTGAVIAYVWEHSERGLIRSPRFRAGAALSLAGAVGLILGGESATLESVGDWNPTTAYAAGLALCVLSALMWPTYSVLVKGLSRKAHPMVIYGYIGTITTGGLWILTLATGGHPSNFTEAPSTLQALVAVSGVVAMAIAHWIYMGALKHLGVAICMVGLLVAPLFTHALGWWIHGETLSPWQWVSVAPLLGGCALAAFRRTRPQDDGNES